MTYFLKDGELVFKEPKRDAGNIQSDTVYHLQYHKVKVPITKWSSWASVTDRCISV
jgi:hypothetical protein